jgi:hypothetical protein
METLLGNTIERMIADAGYRGHNAPQRVHGTLWRGLEYECAFLNAFGTGSGARVGIGPWFAYYNTEWPSLLVPHEDARRGLCYETTYAEIGGVKCGE